MKLKTEHLHVFRQVVDSRGFTAAGKVLGVSKVAISKQISQLEATLKTRLINRDTRKFALTEQGMALYQDSQSILDQLEEIQMQFSMQQVIPHGSLKVMATPHFGQLFLLPYLAEFLERYPKIELEVLLEERFPHLENENIDIFMGASLPGYDTLVRKKLWQTRYVFCASPIYLKENDTPNRPNDLINHRYLNHAMRQSNVVTFKNSKELQIKPYLLINDTQALLTCTLNNMGIVKLHEYVVRDALKRKKLVEVLPEFSEDNVPIYIFYTEQKYLPSKTRVMLEFIYKKIENF